MRKILELNQFMPSSKLMGHLKPAFIFEWEFAFAFSRFYLQAEIWNQLYSYNEGLLCIETPTQ